MQATDKLATRTLRFERRIARSDQHRHAAVEAVRLQRFELTIPSPLITTGVPAATQIARGDKSRNRLDLIRCQRSIRMKAL